MKTGLPVMLIMVLLTCVGQADEAFGPVSVMSFNIRYNNPADEDNAWAHRRAAVADYLRSEAPDLISMQEALHDQFTYLADALPEYTAIGVGRNDGQESGEYCPIFVRDARFEVLCSWTFWLSPNPDQPGSVGYGNAVTRIVTWAEVRDRKSGSVLRLYNTHFDHQSERARLLSAVQLQDSIAALPADMPVLVTGDFNSPIGDDPVQALLRPAVGSGHRAFTDSYFSLHPTAHPSGTYHDWTGNWTGRKIDFVLIDDHWTALNAAILHDRYWGQWLSDHAPVSATLLLGSRAAETGPATR